MKVLEVNNLHTYFKTKKGLIKAANGVTFSIDEGKTMGLVGESGSGKSVTAMSILQLFEENQKIYDGSIVFEGEEISKFTQEQMRKIRGNQISVIFQEPMTSLNPVLKIERQISEVLMLHQGLTKKQARIKSLEMLRDVRISNPEHVLDQYAFQLSGGMSQRVMIAMALACKPKLLIADEPTTALDVTIQAQILELMRELKEKTKTAILFVTHDMGVIHEMADDVAVMYCGMIMERVDKETLFSEDTKFMHPYTEGILFSIPRLDTPKGRLDVIEGSVPHPLNLPDGCKFAPRCKYRTKRCTEQEIPMYEVEAGHLVRCIHPRRFARDE